MISALLVFFGGGLGSVCRYSISQIFDSSLFPYGTLTSNIVSCFILGIFLGFSSEEIFRNQHRLLLMTGFCGGFSTFSTYSGEIVNLFQQGQSISAFSYMALSIIAGLASIVAGLFLSRALLS